MIDALKNNENCTTFSAENVKKVTVDILFNKGRKDFLWFHKAFEGYDILGVHLLQKDDWFYGLYYGSDRVGFVYPYEKLTVEQQIKAFNRYLPLNINNLSEKVQIYTGQLEFHHCKPDSYFILGETHDKQILTETKKIKR